MPNLRKQCDVTSCEREAEKRGWCSMHYQRWRKHGDPLMVLCIRGDLEARFWSKVARTEADECWLWTAGLSPTGYGVCWDGSRDRKAHAIAYELEVGPIPDGLELDHLCRNPPCVNPSHLEPVTHAENMHRGPGSITHCKRGHEFTPGNTYIAPKSGSRFCCTCNPNRRSNVEDRPLIAHRLGLVVRPGDPEWKELGA